MASLSNRDSAEVSGMALAESCNHDEKNAIESC